LFDCVGDIVMIGGGAGLASIGFTGLIFGGGKGGIMDLADGGKIYDE
jgi:hypothetical protein